MEANGIPAHQARQGEVWRPFHIRTAVFEFDPPPEFQIIFRFRLCSMSLTRMNLKNNHVSSIVDVVGHERAADRAERGARRGADPEGAVGGGGAREGEAEQRLHQELRAGEGAGRRVCVREGRGMVSGLSNTKRFLIP